MLISKVIFLNFKNLTFSSYTYHGLMNLIKNNNGFASALSQVKCCYFTRPAGGTLETGVYFSTIKQSNSKQEGLEIDIMVKTISNWAAAWDSTKTEGQTQKKVT